MFWFFGTQMIITYARGLILLNIWEDQSRGTKKTHSSVLICFICQYIQIKIWSFHRTKLKASSNLYYENLFIIFFYVFLFIHTGSSVLVTKCSLCGPHKSCWQKRNDTVHTVWLPLFWSHSSCLIEKEKTKLKNAIDSKYIKLEHRSAKSHGNQYTDYCCTLIIGNVHP